MTVTRADTGDVCAAICVFRVFVAYVTYRVNCHTDRVHFCPVSICDHADEEYYSLVS